MRHEHSLSADYFEQMFRGTPDPWNFRTSAYETAKYDHTVEALGARRYQRGFEIGCANGVLTGKLAARCDSLLAIDVSETALALATSACADQPHVRFARMTFPAEAPADAHFDLIVLSEVAYYWDDRDLARAALAIAEACIEGGDLLLVHWTGDTDYPQSGDAAVEALKAHLGEQFDAKAADSRDHYRLDLWRRR